MAKKRQVKDDSTIEGSGTVPDLRLDFVIVEHGYQCDLYVDGKLIEIECRDFGGDHPINESALKLAKRLQKAIAAWRNAL